MYCQKHNKEIQTTCTWCGRDLCRLCISKTDGKKAYCSSCVEQIGPMLKEKQLKQIKEVKEGPTREQGYFDFNKFIARK